MMMIVKMYCFRLYRPISDRFLHPKISAKQRALFPVITVELLIANLAGRVIYYRRVLVLDIVYKVINRHISITSYITSNPRPRESTTDPICTLGIVSLISTRDVPATFPHEIYASHMVPPHLLHQTSGHQ